MRTTKHREAILDILTHSDTALTAADIHRALPHMNLVTIYRNLEQFVLLGTIKKMFLADGEALFEYQTHPHHHAVCDDCHKVIHFTAPDEKIKKLLGLEDFSIKNLEVTVHGLCSHDTPTKTTR
jgi:Fur family peroxide stress response transcriptional regulator